MGITLSVAILLATLASSAAQEPPEITSISRSSGYDVGDQAITLEGSGLETGLTVTFGGKPATVVKVIGGTRVNARTPAHPVGLVDVTVTNPDGQTATLKDAYEFVFALFGSPEAYPGVRTAGLLGADLDGDADVDFVLTNYFGTSVKLYLGNGDGTFEDGGEYHAGSGPYSITSDDVDGDGDADLVTVCQGGYTLSVLPNRGDGTFDPPVHYSSNKSSSIAKADLDGDGDSDFATANPERERENSHVSVFFNEGGTFANRVDFHYGSFVSTADMDGDGDSDLVVASSMGSELSVLLNDGDGSFALQRIYDFPNAVTSNRCADFDGDGDADVALITHVEDGLGWRMSLLRNRGDGILELPEDHPVRGSASGSAVADFDGDGSEDFVTGNWDGNTVGVLLNNGDGSFAAPQDYPFAIKPGAVCGADVDGDGDSDLTVASAGARNLLVSLNRSNLLAPTAVTVRSDLASLPGVLALGLNYPNPFNPQTVIPLHLPVRAHVELAVFNETGQRVAMLVDGERPAGRHAVLWDGRDDGGCELGSGVYLCRLLAGERRVETRKLLLLR